MEPQRLLLAERVKNEIQFGESQFREFKSALEGQPRQKRPRSARAICADIGEALVAFANSDGGVLLIGVEDSGEVTGVPHDAEDIQSMLAAPRTHVRSSASLPLAEASVLRIDNESVIFFAVNKGTSEIYQLPDGRCVGRKDRETVPISPAQLHFDRQETKSREYDRQFVDGASVRDLDTDLLQSVANDCLPGLSFERYLQQMGLAEYEGTSLRLRMAALLLFSRTTSKWHPGSYVRILKTGYP